MIDKLKTLKNFLLSKNLKKEAEELKGILKLAAKRDAEELLRINLSQISKNIQKPEEMEPRAFYTNLKQQAEHGPIFSKPTIDFLNAMSDQDFPKENRKTFTKWLANQYEQNPMGYSEISFVVDWLDGINWSQEINLEQMSFHEAYDKSEEWHQQSFEVKETPIKHYQTQDIIYSFNNGYTIQKVPAQDLETEGDMMGHCVGGYGEDVAGGITEIYSLRDPNNKPHATIELSRSPHLNNGKTVRQIKGKENKIPIMKYSDMIKEFLNQTDWTYKDEEDFILMPPNDEVVKETIKEKGEWAIIENRWYISRPELLNGKQDIINEYWKKANEEPDIMRNMPPTKILAENAPENYIKNIFAKRRPLGTSSLTGTSPLATIIEHGPIKPAKEYVIENIERNTYTIKNLMDKLIERDASFALEITNKIKTFDKYLKEILSEDVTYALATRKIKEDIPTQTLDELSQIYPKAFVMNRYIPINKRILTVRNMDAKTYDVKKLFYDITGRIESAVGGKLKNVNIKHEITLTIEILKRLKNMNTTLSQTSRKLIIALKYANQNTKLFQNEINENFFNNAINQIQNL